MKIYNDLINLTYNHHFFFFKKGETFVSMQWVKSQTEN